MVEKKESERDQQKSPQYLLYNNLGIIMGIVMMIAKRHQRVNIAHIAIFLPLLLDDNVVRRANQGTSYRIINLIAIDKVNIANMNDRYRHSLLLLVNALAVLQDFDAVRIVKEDVEYIQENPLEGMIGENICDRLLKIKRAYNSLWRSQQEMELKDMYHLLGIMI
jgi:hypothetical protein